MSELIFYGGFKKSYEKINPISFYFNKLVSELGSDPNILIRSFPLEFEKKYNSMLEAEIAKEKEEINDLAMKRIFFFAFVFFVVLSFLDLLIKKFLDFLFFSTNGWLLLICLSICFFVFRK